MYMYHGRMYVLLREQWSSKERHLDTLPFLQVHHCRQTCAHAYARPPPPPRPPPCTPLQAVTQVSSPTTKQDEKKRNKKNGRVHRQAHLPGTYNFSHIHQVLLGAQNLVYVQMYPMPKYDEFGSFSGLLTRARQRQRLSEQS